MANQDVPALRLEGFDGEWESIVLGEHSYVTTGSSDVQDADPDGIYPFFVRSQHVERSNKYLFDGEAILVPGEGRLGEIFHYYVGKFDFHQRVYRISNFEGVDGKYVYWAMQHSFKDHAMQNTVKATVDSLRQPTITGFTFQKPPTLEEQQAIGAAFTNLDAAIDLHTKKHRALQQAKTALMQRMFPQEGQTVPELRLDGFSGRWSYRRLCELAAVKDSARIHNSMWATDGVRYIRSSDVKTGLRDCDLYISHKVFDRYSRLTGSPRRGDVLFTSGGEIGVPHFYDSDEPVYLQGGAVLNVVTSESKELDGRFLTVLFETTDVRDYIAATSTGGTIKHFVVGPAREIPVFLPPTLEEQQAIGAIFTNLDQLIAAEARYIASLKQAKTALLQRMFI